MTINFIKYKFNEKYFLKIIPNKKNIILDYGCGKGVFTKITLKDNKIGKILCYDIDKNLKKFIKKKYIKNRKIRWINNYHNHNFNIVLINSVIQYIDKYQWKKTLNFFLNKKSVKIIIISDISFYHRIIEIFYLLVFFPSIFIKFLKFYLNRDYISTKYYFKTMKEIISKKNNIKFEKKNNFFGNHLPRYSLIIKKIIN